MSDEESSPGPIIARLEKLAGGDGDPPLGETAILLGALDRPDTDIQPYLDHLDELSAALSGTPAETAEDRAAALAAVLHGNFGYDGDRDDYDDMANANLMDVIDRRRGLPVALAILYIEVARLAGWGAWGLDFPGHFVLRLDGEKDRAIIDPFHGGVVVELPVLRQMLKTYVGEGAELDPQYYEPMPDRAILLRLLNNIRGRALNAGDKTRGLEIMDRMVMVAPGDPRIWLESAAIKAQAGHLVDARSDIDKCLSMDMPPEERLQAEQLAQSLRRGLN